VETLAILALIVVTAGGFWLGRSTVGQPAPPDRGYVDRPVRVVDAGEFLPLTTTSLPSRKGGSRAAAATVPA
jgi:hypothetical protein